MLRYIIRYITHLGVVLLGVSASAPGAERPTRTPLDLSALNYDEVNSVGIHLARMPAGPYLMGREAGGDWDESPPHRVTIRKPFLISVTEVTLEQYRQFAPDHSAQVNGKATGMSWHDAVAFCDWLTKKENKPYRLPTEAEWEYAARAGTTGKFWSGNEMSAAGAENPWGLRGIHDAPMEWCHDWYGPYLPGEQTDPVGPADGLCRVVRGGQLDFNDPSGRFVEPGRKPADYAASANRSGLPPAMGVMQTKRKPESAETAPAPSGGLIGNSFGNADFTRPVGVSRFERSDNRWGEQGGSTWSARWVGFVEGPATGEVTFHAVANDGVRLTVDGKAVIDGLTDSAKRSGAASLKKGEKHAVTLEFTSRSGRAELNLAWSWSGQDKTPVPATAWSHSAAQAAEFKEAPKPSGVTGGHGVGFRVVQMPVPPAQPTPVSVPFIQQCVKPVTDLIQLGPEPKKPFFRRRFLLPIPPDNSPDTDIAAAGLHPSFRRHNHSPALEVCPNGDLLMVIYTSYEEYESGVSLMATRLRFGAEEWDMPELMLDVPDANDHAPLLWTDWGKTRQMFLFWGLPRLDMGAYPFQWTTSADSGATWSAVRFPQFEGDIGPHSRQPINTVLRGADGALYVPSDGAPGTATSVLWVSRNDGETWSDPESRTAGRHTTLCWRSDGAILGFGGKSSDIDGYMPLSVSTNGGTTWQTSRSQFPAQANNQRPSVLRLQSGHLFFAGDFQDLRDNSPAPITNRGAYVALSRDEGRTWRFKPLPGALPHETYPDTDFHKGANTLGYSAARQAPNGQIHLITTMNTPCLHFEMNEAWIESDAEGAAAVIHSPAVKTGAVAAHTEKHPNGKVKATWEGGKAQDGRYALHGRENWFFEDGRKQYEATYQSGRKSGTETLWRPDGSVLWQWEHQPNGTGVWTQFWEDGTKKSVSTWRDHKANGPAQCWDRNGKLISDVTFSEGRRQ